MNNEEYKHGGLQISAVSHFSSIMTQGTVTPNTELSWIALWLLRTKIALAKCSDVI